jgi:hypothetical protein
MILEVILLASLFHHKKKPATPPERTLSQAARDGVDMVMQITKLMGPYIADSNEQGRFEQDKIDAVEADIMLCYQGESSTDEAGFLQNVEKLKEDMHILAAYDHMLQVEDLI